MEQSVTRWLQSLREGDQEVVRELWARYFRQLVQLARGRLPCHARRAFDEEDVALSALRSFLDGAREERFPRLEDRHDLWALLLIITRRKARAYLRRETRRKRGAGRVLGDSGVNLAGALGVEGGFDSLIGEEPTPAFAAEAAEQSRLLLDDLGDEALRTVAVLKMQGHTVDEIAAQTDSTKRTVERRLQMIRKKWSETLAEEEQTS